MSPDRKPGDAGWKPSEEDVLAAQGPEPGLVLRVVSVLPFVLGGAFGVIAFVAWIVMLVLGVGTDRGAVWTWAEGRPAGEVVVQVGLLILIGLACAGVVALSIYATAYGFRTRQPRHFWAVAAGRVLGSGVRPAPGALQFPEFMEDIGLTGGQWYFAFGVVAFAMIVVGLRMRRGGDDEEDGIDG